MTTFALVNPDVVVEPGWLAPLALALDRDPGLGAVAPKVLLASRYQALRLESRGPARRAHGRVRLTGVRVADRDVTELTRYGRGWSGPDGTGPDRGRWLIDPIAELAVPTVDEDPVGGALRLRGCGERLVSVTVGDGREAFTVDPADAWHTIVLNGAARSLLNGVGVELSREGFASDHGYLEPDEGQFDVPGEIDAWSGSAVLLRGSFLETVGPFDERLFLYYEDIDLSLHGRELGWRYEAVPASMVRHAHSASTVADSDLVRYYNDRNRLLVLARHRGTGAVTRAALRFVAVTASYGVRDLRATFGRGACVPERGVAASRVRAFWGFVQNLPAALVARRRWRVTAGQRALKSSPQTADG